MNCYGADQSAENRARVNIKDNTGEDDDGRKGVNRGEGERGEGVEGTEGDWADEGGKRVL